jgi:hypothetical protein
LWWCDNLEPVKKTRAHDNPDSLCRFGGVGGLEEYFINGLIKKGFL